MEKEKLNALVRLLMEFGLSRQLSDQQKATVRTVEQWVRDMRHPARPIMTPREPLP